MTGARASTQGFNSYRCMIGAPARVAMPQYRGFDAMIWDLTKPSADASAEVNERRLRRYPAPLEANLMVDGDLWHCRIRDISVAGAGLDPAIPAA
ncbi:MAG: PilZ domain-containing protein, partial [Geminicoccales bacterium]